MRPEPRAGRLEVRDQLAGLEVRAAVERHVLEHVREPLLVVGLVERSGLDRQPQQHALGRAPVLADEDISGRSAACPTMTAESNGSASCGLKVRAGAA